MSEQRHTNPDATPISADNPHQDRWVSLPIMVILIVILVAAALFVTFKLTVIPYQAVERTEEIAIEGGGTLHLIYPRLLGWRESEVNPDKRIIVSARDVPTDTLPVTVLIVPASHGVRLVSAKGEPISGQVVISPTDNAVFEADLYLQQVDLDSPPPWDFEAKVFRPGDPDPNTAKLLSFTIQREPWLAGVLRRSYNSIPWGTYLLAVLALVSTGLRWLWKRNQAAHEIIDQRTEQELLRAVGKGDIEGQHEAIQKIKADYEQYRRAGYVLGLRIPRQKPLEASYRLACAQEACLEFVSKIEREKEFDKAIREESWQKERNLFEESWQSATKGYEKYGYAQGLRNLRIVLLCWLENHGTPIDWEGRARRYDWESLVDCAQDLIDCLITDGKKGGRFARWLAASSLPEICQACEDERPGLVAQDILKQVARDDPSWRVRKRAALRLIFAQKTVPASAQLKVRTASGEQVVNWMRNFARAFDYEAFASLSAELLDWRFLQESFSDPFHILDKLLSSTGSMIVYGARGEGATTLRVMLANELEHGVHRPLVLSLTDWPQKVDWSLDTYVHALRLAVTRCLGQSPTFPWRSGYQEKLDALHMLVGKNGYERVCVLVDNVGKGPAAKRTAYVERVRPLLECPIFFQQPWLHWVLFLPKELESELLNASAVEGGWVDTLSIRWRRQSPPTEAGSEPLLELIDRRLQATTSLNVMGRDALFTPQTEGRRVSEELLAYWARTPRQIVRFFDRLFQHRAALFADSAPPLIDELDLAAIIASMSEEAIPPT
jgi:hypothetical protein